MQRIRTSAILVRGLLLAAGLVLTGADRAAAQSTTVIVVRHAETTGQGSDPALSEAGSARAARLAAAVQHAGVDAVYTTQLQRTRLTGAPVARALGIEPNVLTAGNPMQAHIDQLVADVKKSAGQTILVVGHSNTVPMIVRALGGPALDQLPETEYDQLFTLIIDAAGTRLVHSRY